MKIALDRSLVFTSASGCRASENLDISSEKLFSPMCQYFLQRRASAYFKIFRGLSNHKEVSISTQRAKCKNINSRGTVVVFKRKYVHRVLVNHIV